MTMVKICGIKTIEEVSILNKFIPDFAGFVFSKSKRMVNIKKASSLISNLSMEIRRVGVFVNEPLSFVYEVYKECGLDVIQLHGDEDIEYINKLKAELGDDVVAWKSIRVKGETEIYEANRIDADAILLDTFSDRAYGGTGEAFNWDIAREYASKNKIALAGGLNVQNVRHAIEKLKPYCVDVSSGVEVNGYKNEIMVKDFILAVKEEVRV